MSLLKIEWFKRWTTAVHNKDLVYNLKTQTATTKLYVHTKKTSTFTRFSSRVNSQKKEKLAQSWFIIIWAVKYEIDWYVCVFVFLIVVICHIQLAYHCIVAKNWVYPDSLVYYDIVVPCVWCQRTQHLFHWFWHPTGITVVDPMQWYVSILFHHSIYEW